MRAREFIVRDIDESLKGTLAGLGLAAATALSPAQAKTDIDDKSNYKIPTQSIQQTKINYSKPGPVTKDSMGQKLEYGIPITADGKFKAPDQSLPSAEYQKQLQAYKSWKTDYMARWPNAVWNADGSVKSAVKPGLAPMFPGKQP